MKYRVKPIKIKYVIACLLILVVCVAGYAFNNNDTVEESHFIVQATNLENAVSAVEVVGATVERPLAIINSVETVLTDVQISQLEMMETVVRVWEDAEVQGASSDFVPLILLSRFLEKMMVKRLNWTNWTAVKTKQISCVNWQTKRLIPKNICHFCSI